MEGLVAGKIVHYVDGITHMAAVVTHVWSRDIGIVNLYVFPDGSFPIQNNTPTSVRFDNSDSPTHGSWHWIEPA